MIGALRRGIEARILGLTSGAGAPRVDFRNPPGDPGLFGPQSACWRVHSDFTSMLVGGVSALLLQSLHPLALAGVWDHSNFRQDLLGRLRRTSAFVAGTTYAARADAERLIARVRGIHARVVGTAPDGRPYAAGDPALLTWVHVAEVSSFLAAYRRYVEPGMDLADQDRYYGEVAVLAEKLGATTVPRSARAVAEYFRALRPQLEYSGRAREIHRILMGARAPSLAAAPFGRMFRLAGVDLLPDWAQAMMGLDRGAGVRALFVRPAVRATAPLLRWGLRDGAAARARQRTGSVK